MKSFKLKAMWWVIRHPWWFLTGALLQYETIKGQIVAEIAEKRKKP